MRCDVLGDEGGVGLPGEGSVAQQHGHHLFVSVPGVEQRLPAFAYIHALDAGVNSGSLHLQTYIH